MTEHTAGPWEYRRGLWGFEGEQGEDGGFHILMGPDEKGSVAEQR